MSTTPPRNPLVPALYSATMQKLADQFREGMYAGLDAGMIREVTIQANAMFAGVAHVMSGCEAEARAAITPCGREGCTCEVLAAKILDCMADTEKAITPFID